MCFDVAKIVKNGIKLDHPMFLLFLPLTTSTNGTDEASLLVCAALFTLNAALYADAMSAVITIITTTITAKASAKPRFDDAFFDDVFMVISPIQV